MPASHPPPTLLGRVTIQPMRTAAAYLALCTLPVAIHLGLGPASAQTINLVCGGKFHQDDPERRTATVPPAATTVDLAQKLASEAKPLLKQASLKGRTQACLRCNETLDHEAFRGIALASDLYSFL